MANIYTKLTDKTLILAPREACIRQFNFGTDWTEVRIGFFGVGVTDAGDNTQNQAESLIVGSNSDRAAIGIKNSSTTDLPGYAGSLFIGAITGTSSSNRSDSGISFDFPGAPSSALCAAGYSGTTLVGGTNAEALAYKPLFGNAAAASGYNGFYGLKFIINNRGLSTQSITLSDRADVVAGTDYSATALRMYLNNSVYGSAITIAWNDGVSARAIPDSYFVRMPFFNNRLRISAIRAIRYQP